MSDEAKKPGAQIIPQREPRPVGMVLDANSLTDYEKEFLAKQGHDGVSPVPSNLADLVTKKEVPPDLQRKIEEATNRLPEGFTATENTFDPTKVPTINDPATVAKALEKYADAVSAAEKPAAPSAFEAARQEGVAAIEQVRSNDNMHPDIAAAIEEIERNSGQTTSTNPATAQAPSQESVDASANPPGTSSEEQPEESAFDRLRKLVPKEDAHAYQEAVLLSQRFEKSYELMGGKLTVTFCEPGPDEDAMALQQESLDAAKGRYDRGDFIGMTSNAARYSFAASLRRVAIQDRPNRVDIPEHLGLVDFLHTLDRKKMTLRGVEDDDTNLRLWHRFLVEKALPGSLYTLLKNKYEEFQVLYLRVRRLAQYPDFFEEPTQSS